MMRSIISILKRSYATSFNKIDNPTGSTEDIYPEYIARLCDASLSILHRTHPLYFLKGPRVTHRNLGMVTHQEGSDIYISECIRRFGIWEPTETDFFLDTLKTGDTLHRYRRQYRLFFGFGGGSRGADRLGVLVRTGSAEFRVA